MISKYNPKFIDIKLNRDNLYVYTARKALQKSLDKNLPSFKGILLDIGCGEMPYKQYILDNNIKIKKYIGVDVKFNKFHQKVKPDKYWSGKKLPFKDSFADTVIATEFFEHVSNIQEVLIEINRTLKKDGLLYFTVPFLWPLHEMPYDEFRYTPFSLTRFLKNAGFINISINPTGHVHYAMAQMLCIWIANSRDMFTFKFQNKFFDFAEKHIFYRLITYLINLDEKKPIINPDNPMQVGFWVTANKS